MGVQSGLVRLLIKGSPSTNVMTTNTSQLAVDATELFLTARARRRAPHDAALAAEHAYVRERLPKIYSRELVDAIFEQPYCRIANLVDKGVAQRQAASRYLQDLVSIGVLREAKVGKEKLFTHPRLLQLLSSDAHEVPSYAGAAGGAPA